MITIVRLVLLTTLTAAPALGSTAGAQPHMKHGSGDRSPALTDAVRQATAPFKDVRQAMDAGYAQFLGCVSGAQEGAMGVHFVKSALVGDGELDVAHPEALVYEPKNGALRLVAAEYIVLADDWHKQHAEPPVLGRQVLQYNSSPNRFGLPPFYELHVWAWRENPHGAFADWNVRVSCEEE